MPDGSILEVASIHYDGDSTYAVEIKVGDSTIPFLIPSPF